MDYTTTQFRWPNDIPTIENDFQKCYVVPTKKAKLIISAVGIGALAVGYFSGINHANARWLLALAKMFSESD